MTTRAPIALFVYKRPLHTTRALESLRKNEWAGESDLYVFCDGPKSDEDRASVAAVRKTIDALTGFRNVYGTFREKNLGLAKSIISGVTDVVNKHGRVIVVEDDLVSSPNFLQFMNQALATYEPNRKIFSVTGYNFLTDIPAGYKKQVFLSYRPSSWGWGTWSDRWSRADWEVKDFPSFIGSKRAQIRFNRGGDDLTGMLVQQMEGKLDSWGIRWCFTHFLHEAYCLVPTISKINNIGFDVSGTHCRTSEKYDVPLDDGTMETELPDDIEIDEDMTKAVHDVHRFTFLQRMRFFLDRWTARYP
jgi:hypothetical protein